MASTGVSNSAQGGATSINRNENNEADLSQGPPEVSSYRKEAANPLLTRMFS
jgi:hypothetical protein